MDMAVHDSLSSGLPRIHSDVEPFDCLIVLRDLGALRVKQSLKRTSLRGEKIEVCRRVPLRNEEGVARCDGIHVAHGNREGIFRDHPARFHGAEDAPILPVPMERAVLTEVFRIPRALVCVALPAQGLVVRQVIDAPQFSGNDVIHLERTLLVRNAAKLASRSRSLQDLVANAAGNVPGGNIPVSE
jgi:hypothetical protein